MSAATTRKAIMPTTVPAKFTQISEIAKYLPGTKDWNSSQNAAAKKPNPGQSATPRQRGFVRKTDVAISPKPRTANREKCPKILRTNI